MTPAPAPLRFAEGGHAAIAFDYFGRTAGAEKRGDECEWMPHVEQTTSDAWGRVLSFVDRHSR